MSAIETVETKVCPAVFSKEWLRARWRRWFKTASGALPGALAILLPKCPLCIAAWVAAGTGVALPAIVASSIRPVLVVVCVLSMSFLVRRAVRQYLSARRPGVVELLRTTSRDNGMATENEGGFRGDCCSRAA